MTAKGNPSIMKSLERLRAVRPSRGGPDSWISQHPDVGDFIRAAMAEIHAGKLTMGKTDFTRFLRSEYGSTLSRQAVVDWIDKHIEGGWNGK